MILLLLFAGTCPRSSRFSSFRGLPADEPVCRANIMS